MPAYLSLLYRTSLLCAVMAPSACLAVDPDECGKQRSQYPSEWNDVSNESPVFTCTSHYAGPASIMLGKPDEAGRRLMSLVLKNGGQDGQPDVYRIWLDKEQVRRLQDGKYFATILRQPDSCWIRGNLGSANADGKDDTVFFMDNADPPADDIQRAGPFYNKAPRFSVFQGNAYHCTRAK